MAGTGEPAAAAAVTGALPAGGATARPCAGACAAARPGGAPPAAVTPPGVSGTSYSTYDQQSGTFIDANGNAAVFGAGAQNLKPQENWYDLMKDPRQT